MGACLSGDAERQSSKEIERLMNEAYAIESDKVKLLLLGAGESGKSTIFKQMRVLHGAPLSEEEKDQITPVVYSNTICSIKLLVQATIDMGYENEVDEENKDKLSLMSDVHDESPITPEIGSIIKALWADPGIKQAWKRRAEFQIVESVKYYFNEIDRIMLDNYVANQQDMLLARVRTSGIVTEKYVIDNKPFEMYDVGGQRNERKKWIHCFEDVTAVIFVAALSEYDQVLFEDSSTNRMTEAVKLFQEICNNQFFASSSMILFLNKRDLFEEKINHVHIGDQVAFKEFTTPLGSSDYYTKGVEYFLNMFLAQNQNSDREVYHHCTCATDTGNVGAVFDACKDIILTGNMSAAGF